MELESTQTSTIAKLPMLKQGDYEMRRLRIKQYFKIQDYALLDVIENGNSFKPVAHTTTNDAGTSTTLIPGLYKDAKTLFAAIETRFGGNEATKKTQKTLLKQLYKNFSATSTKSFDSIFNSLQKIVSQLVVLGVFISQKDLNLKFLRSFPSEWNTHVVVWRNKFDLDTISIDDLYNNFKIVEQEVKGIACSDSSSQNMDFVTSPSTDSTNEVPTAYRNQDSSRRTVNVEETPPKAMVSIDGVGFDWSYMAEDEVPTNMALMAFSDSKIDLSYSGLEEFHQHEFESYGTKSCKIESKNSSENISNELKESIEVKESSDVPLVKKLVSDDKLEKKTVVPTDAKIEFVKAKQHEKPVKKPVKYAEMYRSQRLRGNQRNWNNLKPQQLGSNFVMYNKVCFVCRSFDHVQAHCHYHQMERVISRNSMKDMLPLGEEQMVAELLMDMKSAFLYGKIEEEVYVYQTLEFEDPDHPDKVYKVVKVLYGLHQALRAWHETLAKYLLGNGFHRGKIDQTLFIKRQNEDILLVQVYVDDIIFGSSKKELCNEFERLVKDSQDKYVIEVLRKFNLSDAKTANTLVDTEKPLVKDAYGDDIDVHLYRSMIVSLMYLTTSRPDIIDYTGANLDRKSTTGGCQFLGRRLISWQCKKQTVVASSTTEAEYVAVVSCCGQVKGKQEKDKIRTKPDENRKRGRAQQCKSLVTVKKAEKEKKIQTKGTNNANPRSKRIEEGQTAEAQNWKLPVCYDDDDDEERSISLQYNIISGLPPCSAITPNEPVDSLSMGDEHLNTIPATESDEFIKTCVENLVPNPSESEGENGCDVLACFTTFSNVLFDAEYEFDSSDDQSLSNEDFPEEIFSNPLFEEEINSMRIDQHHFNAESDVIESMLNHDSSIIFSSSKIDSLLDEFAGELTLLKSIPPGIDGTDCHPENEIRFTERLLYDNSSPRPPEEFVSENSNANIESFSPSPIPTEDSDSFMKEIDLTFIRMTQCRRALRKMMMTLKGILLSMKNRLTIIPFHSL
nr:hypothetical protein [Tanacetum cinerariifolium]